MVVAMTDEELTARQILDQLQAAVSDRDVERLAELFDDDGPFWYGRGEC